MGYFEPVDIAKRRGSGRGGYRSAVQAAGAGTAAGTAAGPGAGAEPGTMAIFVIIFKRLREVKYSSC